MAQKVVERSLSELGYSPESDIARIPDKAIQEIGIALAAEAKKVVSDEKLSKIEKQKSLLSIKYALHQALVNSEIRRILKSVKIDPATPFERLKTKDKIHVVNRLWGFFAARIIKERNVAFTDKLRMFYSLRDELRQMKKTFETPEQTRATDKSGEYKSYYFDSNAFEIDYSQLSIDDIDPFYRFREHLFETFEQIQEMNELLSEIFIPLEYEPMRITNAKKGDILLTKGGSDIGASISAMMGSSYTSAMMFVDDGYTVKKVSMDFNAVGIETWENNSLFGSYDDTFRRLDQEELANGIPGVEQRRIEDVYAPLAFCDARTQEVIYKAVDAVLIKPESEDQREILHQIADKYMDLSGYYRLNALMDIYQMDNSGELQEGRGATDGSGIWHAYHYALRERLNVRHVDATQAMEYAHIVFTNYYHAMLGEEYTPQWYQDYTHKNDLGYLNIVYTSAEEFCEPGFSDLFSPAGGGWEFIKNGISWALLNEGLSFTSVAGIVIFAVKTAIWSMFENYGEETHKKNAMKIANQICNTIFFDDPGNTSHSWRHTYRKEEGTGTKSSGRKSSARVDSSFFPDIDPHDIQDLPGYDPENPFGCPPGDQVLPDDLLPEHNGSPYYRKIERPEIEGGYYHEGSRRIDFK